MKSKVLRGVVVTVVVLAVLIVVNIICNINHINLDSTLTGVSASVCAMLIYEGLEKKAEEKEAVPAEDTTEE